MKRLLLTAALLALAALPSRAATATFTYTFNWPKCASASSTNCLSGFSVVSGPTVIGSCPAPSTAPASTPAVGAAVPITCQFTGASPALGSVPISIVVNYQDNTGAAQMSAITPANTQTVKIDPNGVTNFVLVFP